MSDLSDKILKKIETDNIKPYSKWHFAGLRSIIWLIFAISILIGSIGAAVSFFLIKNAEWDLYKHFGHSFGEFTLLILPWFWFIFIGIFTIIAFYYYRKTEKGYRMNTLKVVFLSIFISVITGLLLNVTSVPKKIETIFDKNMPLYSQMHKHRHQMWMKPEQGFLAGTIHACPDKTMIILKDLDGKDWQVDISNAEWCGQLSTESGTKIKITGSLQSYGNGASSFKADEIRPWQGKGMGRMKGRGRMNHKSCGKRINKDHQ